MELTGKDKKFIKKLRNEMKKLEIDLKKFMEKQRRGKILRGLE